MARHQHLRSCACTQSDTVHCTWQTKPDDGCGPHLSSVTWQMSYVSSASAHSCCITAKVITSSHNVMMLVECTQSSPASLHCFHAKPFSRGCLSCMPPSQEVRLPYTGACVMWVRCTQWEAAAHSSMGRVRRRGQGAPGEGGGVPAGRRPPGGALHCDRRLHLVQVLHPPLPPREPRCSRMSAALCIVGGAAGMHWCDHTGIGATVPALVRSPI